MSKKTTQTKQTDADTESVVQNVRKRYGAFATAGTSCCGPQPTTCCDSSGDVALRLGYDSVDLDLLPDGANLGLGCGRRWSTSTSRRAKPSSISGPVRGSTLSSLRERSDQTARSSVST